MFYHVLFLQKKKKKKKSLILSIFLSRLSQRNKPRRNPAFNLTAEFAVSCVPMCRVKREASGDFFFFSLSQFPNLLYEIIISCKVRGQNNL